MLLRKIITLLFLATLIYPKINGQEQSKFSWQSLKNPVLSYENWSIKDYGCVFHNDTFFVFFSAFYLDNGAVRSHVVEVTTTDFIHYSEPVLNDAGTDRGFFGLCSPDVSKIGDTWYLTYNSWVKSYNDEQTFLYYRTSKDLKNWGPDMPLAKNLTNRDDRKVGAIDGVLYKKSGTWFLMYKENRILKEGKLVKDRQVARVAQSVSPDSAFHWIKDGFPSFSMPDGKDNGFLHENFQFFTFRRKLHVLTSDYWPFFPWIYQIDEKGKEPINWMNWKNGFKLELPQETFNSETRGNGACLIKDAKGNVLMKDGYTYILYAGTVPMDAGVNVSKFAGRGHNKLGIARSKDLVNWVAPEK